MGLSNDLNHVFNSSSLNDIREESTYCSKALKPHYTRFGTIIHYTLPLSINWIITTLFMKLIPSYAQSHTHELGRHFVRWAQKADLKAIAERIVEEGPINLSNDRAAAYALSAKKSIYIKLEQSTDGLCVPARAPLETLVWKCAKILGLEDYFSPTRPLHPIGVFQLEVKGKSLISLNNGGFIGTNKSQTIAGFMISVFFGFTDANNHNLILDESDQLRFIDVVRCFPHSNDFIIRGEQGNEQLITSFRCGLFSYSESYRPLSEADWVEIENYMSLFTTNLQQIKEKIQKLRSAKLPADWVDVDLMIKALDERMKRMATIVEQRSVSNLRDFVFAVHPRYRFIAALTLAQLPSRDVSDEGQMSSEEKQVLSICDAVEACHQTCEDTNNPEEVEIAHIVLQRFAFEGICGFGFDLKAILNGPTRIDVTKLYEMCRDDSKPFGEIISAIAQSENEYQSTQVNALKIWNELKKNAKRDCKT